MMFFLQEEKKKSATVKSKGGNDDERLAGRDAGDLGVGNEVDGIGATGVLGNARVLVVGLASRVVVGDVLEDGTEADGAEDLGLLLSVETDALGVAVKRKS
jgi:hypothetical protein